MFSSWYGILLCRKTTISQWQLLLIINFVVVTRYILPFSWDREKPWLGEDLSSWCAKNLRSPHECLSRSTSRKWEISVAPDLVAATTRVGWIFEPMGIDDYDFLVFRIMFFKNALIVTSLCISKHSFKSKYLSKISHFKLIVCSSMYYFLVKAPTMWILVFYNFNMS